MSKKIKKGLKVLVITGKFKGTKGVITGVKGEKVMVDNLPKIKKGRKANPAAQKEAGYDMIDRSIHISNVKALSEGDAK